MKKFIYAALFLIVIVFILGTRFGGYDSLSILDKLGGWHKDYSITKVETGLNIGGNLDNTIPIIKNTAIREINGEKFICLVTDKKTISFIGSSYDIGKFKLEKIQIGPNVYNFGVGADWSQVQEIGNIPWVNWQKLEIVYNNDSPC